MKHLNFSLYKILEHISIRILVLWQKAQKLSKVQKVFQVSFYICCSLGFTGNGCVLPLDETLTFAHYSTSKDFAFYYPIMDYCGTVWNCCGVGNSSSLERLQRRAAKIVWKISNSDKALDCLKWQSLVNRRESYVNELVKRCIKGHCSHFFKNYLTFNSSVHNWITRPMNMLHSLRVRTDLAKTLFFYVCMFCNF